MTALANFFRIKPEYFTDDEYYEKLDKELTWLAHMRDEGVRRIAARTVGLSPEAQQDVVEKVDELRRREHLGQLGWHPTPVAAPQLAGIRRPPVSCRYWRAISRIQSRSEQSGGCRSQRRPGKIVADSARGRRRSIGPPPVPARPR